MIIFFQIKIFKNEILQKQDQISNSPNFLIFQSEHLVDLDSQFDGPWLKFGKKSVKALVIVFWDWYQLIFLNLLKLYNTDKYNVHQCLYSNLHHSGFVIMIFREWITNCSYFSHNEISIKCIYTYNIPILQGNVSELLRI